MKSSKTKGPKSAQSESGQASSKSKGSPSKLTKEAKELKDLKELKKAKEAKDSSKESNDKIDSALFSEYIVGPGFECDSDSGGRQVLRLGLPKGSLEQYTINLLSRAGWRVNIGSRNYFPDIDDAQINCTLARAQEMSRYVASGVLDCGLSGRDWRLENQSDVAVITDLVYSKATPAPARWVLAVAGDGPYRTARDLVGRKVATELPGVTKRWFEERHIDVNVEFSWGATEAKVVSGLADAVVEVTETGSTIKAHGLKIIDEILSTNTELIANHKALESRFKKYKIDQLALLLKGALDAEGLVGLKMNVRAKDVENVVALLPSLNAPTIAHLYNSDWLSVEIVVSSKVVRELIPVLCKVGAEGIIEYSLNKVI